MSIDVPLDGHHSATMLPSSRRICTWWADGWCTTRPSGAQADSRANTTMAGGVRGPKCVTEAAFLEFANRR
jgi:hypothetical protein